MEQAASCKPVQVVISQPRLPSSPTKRYVEEPPLTPPQSHHLLCGLNLLEQMLGTGLECPWRESILAVGTSAPAVLALGLGNFFPDLLPVLPALSAYAIGQIRITRMAQHAWASMVELSSASIRHIPPLPIQGALDFYMATVGLKRSDVLPPYSPPIDGVLDWVARLLPIFPFQVRVRSLFGESGTTFYNRHRHPYRHPPSQARRHFAPRNTIKLGEHSIHSTQITTDLLLDTDAPVTPLPDFLHLYSSALRDNATNFQHVPAVIRQIGSGISLSVAGVGYEAPVQEWGTVLVTHAAPIPIGDPVARHDLVVVAEGAKDLGRFTQTAIAPLLQAGVPSERFVSSAIQPSLTVMNPNALRSLTASIMEGWEYYDNSTLYAKLWHYVLVHDFFTSFGVYLSLFPSLPAIIPPGLTSLIPT